VAGLQPSSTLLDTSGCTPMMVYLKAVSSLPLEKQEITNRKTTIPLSSLKVIASEKVIPLSIVSRFIMQQ
jgi:hypothetical protein